jgi:hypothetical protein
MDGKSTAQFTAIIQHTPSNKDERNNSPKKAFSENPWYRLSDSTETATSKSENTGVSSWGHPHQQMKIHFLIALEQKKF